MNDERVVEEIVTKFLLNTCRLRPQFSKPAVQAAVLCGRLVAHQLDDDTEADLIPLITGSVAEFYIEPMISHVGDVDVISSLHSVSNTSGTATTDTVTR